MRFWWEVENWLRKMLNLWIPCNADWTFWNVWHFISERRFIIIKIDLVALKMVIKAEKSAAAHNKLKLYRLFSFEDVMPLLFFFKFFNLNIFNDSSLTKFLLSSVSCWKEAKMNENSVGFFKHSKFLFLL